MNEERPRQADDSAGTAGTGTAELIGYGRLTWDQLTRMIGDAPAAWADYDGFHIGRAPAEPPSYSHLWAWTGQWLLRARVEGEHAIVGVLALTAPPAGAPPSPPGDQVTYHRASSQSWSLREQRVGPMTPDTAGRSFDIFLIPGNHPVTFVTAVPPR